MNNVSILEVLNVLELPQSTIDFVQGSKSPAEIQKGLDKFKEVARHQRRILARKYHPDIYSDDNKMKLINNAVDVVNNLKVQAIPKPKQVVRCYYYYQTFSYSTSSTTADSGGFC